MDRYLPSKSPSKLSNCQKTDRVAVRSADSGGPDPSSGLIKRAKGPGHSGALKKIPVEDRDPVISSDDDDDHVPPPGAGIRPG